MELKGPSEAEIKKFIKFETLVDFYTINNLHFRGRVVWADNFAFHIQLEGEKQVTIAKTALAYYSGN